MLREKTIPIVLLIALTLPLGLTFSYLHFKKKAVKREIKWKMIEGMDKNELEVLTFSLDEADSKLDWEHDHEFEYNGQMYDVVEKEVTNDSVTYWCWWDHNETQLSKKLSTLLNDALGADAQHQDKEGKLLQYLKDLYFNNLGEVNLEQYEQTAYHSGEYNSLYTSPYTFLKPRPPEVLYA